LKQSGFGGDVSFSMGFLILGSGIVAAYFAFHTAATVSLVGVQEYSFERPEERELFHDRVDSSWINLVLLLYELPFSM
jgi:hypothetical protein